MKTFGDLKPGDSLWYTFNLKDPRYPEEAIVKDVIHRGNLSEILLEPFDGDGRSPEYRNVPYRILVGKDIHAYPGFYITKELAVCSILKQLALKRKQLIEQKTLLEAHIKETEERIQEQSLLHFNGYNFSESELLDLMIVYLEKYENKKFDDSEDFYKFEIID